MFLGILIEALQLTDALLLSLAGLLIARRVPSVARGAYLRKAEPPSPEQPVIRIRKRGL